MSERPRIVIDDVDFEWDLENDLMLCMGQPVVCMWIETTLAGIMHGIHRMVGTDRFVLAAEQSGRESVEGEWRDVIVKHPTIEDGIRWCGRASGTCGLGEFELLSMDRAKKEARFRIRNGWEALYQRALGVSWGSSTMAGRIAGYCTKAFDTYCRAEQTAFVARGDQFDEFVVRPAHRTLEEELAALLGAENTTQADLVAALDRLRREIMTQMPVRQTQPAGHEPSLPPMERARGGERPRIVAGDLDFEWERDAGMMFIWGKPVVCMWIETTMAGLMSGLHRMVGTERFVLAAEQAGRESIVYEWEHIILSQPTVEAGLHYIGRASRPAGLGRWELVSLDRATKEARFRCYNTWEGLYQKALGVSWGTSTMAGKLGAYCTNVFGTYCRAEQIAFVARGDAYDEFVVRPSARTVEQQLEALIGADSAAAAHFAAAFDRLRSAVEERGRMEQELRREVEERRRVEEELLAKLDVIKLQEEAIRAMSTPILRLWRGVLTMPVIGIVDEDRASRMMHSLLEEITRTQASFTILDLTGVEQIDTIAASHLLQIVQAARLIGTRCLISGVSPTMASTMVSLGLDLGTLKTFGTLEAALRSAIQESRADAASLGGEKGRGARRLGK